MSTSQPTVLRRLRANLDAVRDRLARAASSAGRSAEEVRLLPVTKSVSPEVAAALVELLAEDGSGPLELAENRLEGLDRKRAAFEREGLEVCWHFIGHLQRNKARRVVRAVDVVHSVDSLRLAETLARVAEEEDRDLSIYLQVNCTGEEAKHGMAPDDLGAAIEVLRGTGRLQLLGLMAMGPLEPRPGYSTEEVFARVLLHGLGIFLRLVAEQIIEGVRLVERPGHLLDDVLPAVPAHRDAADTPHRPAHRPAEERVLRHEGHLHVEEHGEGEQVRKIPVRGVGRREHDDLWLLRHLAQHLPPHDP